MRNLEPMLIIAIGGLAILGVALVGIYAMSRILGGWQGIRGKLSSATDELADQQQDIQNQMERSFAMSEESLRLQQESLQAQHESNRLLARLIDLMQHRERE